MEVHDRLAESSKAVTEAAAAQAAEQRGVVGEARVQQHEVVVQHGLLAAQLAHPDKRIVIVYGDGSFGLNGFEYDTAVRFGLPIIGIVGNDGAWGQMMRPLPFVWETQQEKTG